MRKLGFGCMRLPLAEAGNFKAVDIAEVERMVDTFLERGFTYFDTAYMYHDFHSARNAASTTSTTTCCTTSTPRTTAPSSASTASPSPPA